MVALAVWLAGTTVVAVWPAVTDAPWESDDGLGTQELRCQDALERRLAAEQTLATPLKYLGSELTMREIGLEEDVKALEQTIAAAEHDIAVFCR